MKIIQGPSRLIKLPIDGGGADINDGALIGPGTTAGTNLGVFVKAAASGADAIGVLEGLHDFSVVGDSAPEDVVSHVLQFVNLALPGSIIAAEYDDTDSITADGGSSGTTLTITSLEDNIDSSWIYVVSGNAAGQLHYVDASAAGSCTLGSTPATAIGTSDEVIKILRPGHGLLKMNTAGDKLGSDAAAGTFVARVIKSQVRYAGSAGWEDLNPTKHDGLTGLNGKQPKFRSLIVLANSFFTPID